jgi:hypothetical protein
MIAFIAAIAWMAAKRVDGPTVYYNMGDPL